MISDLVMLQKTGQSDSNLLSIQSKGEKNASYSTAVRENPGGAAFMTTLMSRNKPTSEQELNQINLKDISLEESVLK